MADSVSPNNVKKLSAFLFKDGDPDPGNLPFSVFVFVVFCRVFLPFFFILVHYITFFIFSL